MKKNEENAVKAWYESLPRNKKTKILVYLQMKLGKSQGTIYARIADNGWSQVEREYINRIMEDGSWDY